MRVTTTPEQAAKVAKLLGLTDLPEGAVLTVTAPKHQPGRACSCGCEGKTSGGLWLPGHDAKHKSKLFGLARDGDAAAVAELTEKDWPQPVAKKAKEVTPEDVTV